MCFLPCFWIVMRLHRSNGLRLWETMLCSCPSTVARSFTLMGLYIICSMAARRVGFARVMKNRWQIFVMPFFISQQPHHMSYCSYE